MEACELLAIELRLDRIEAELASELPPHLRTFARAHARGSPPPPAPDVLYRAGTLATARAALAHPVLADRGLALLRLAGPVALESDPQVSAARAASPSWDALSVLAAARDAAAFARFGRRAIDVMHRLHGSAAAGAVGSDGTGARGSPLDRDARQAARRGPQVPDRPVTGADEAAPEIGGERAAARDAAQGDRDAPVADGVVRLPRPVAAWFRPDGVEVDEGAIARAWEAIRVRHGVDGAVRFERAAGARPRTFVIDPRREVVIAIPARIATPAERFAILHELGHAVLALALSGDMPRIVDEAVAAYVAAAIERESCAWYSPAAGPARSRRLALARRLDRIERALPQIPELAARPAERPPWALWHDPGAQAAYVAAESLASEIERAIGPSPPPGALAAIAGSWCEVIARATSAI